VEGFVLPPGSLLDLGIMSVQAGDFAVFVLKAMGAAATKTLEGAAPVRCPVAWQRGLIALVLCKCARRRGLIALVLRKCTLGLARICPDDGQSKCIRDRRASEDGKHMEALPGDAAGNVLDLMNLVLCLLSGG
jgi:hypothetical protein